MSPSQWSPSLNERRLLRRYLVWCYKTTKEELDRLDRYETQLRVDRFVRGRLEAGTVDVEQVRAFDAYVQAKEKRARAARGADPARYGYLRHRLTAVEEAVRVFLGEAVLDEIVRSYEEEMTSRILRATDH